MRTFLRSVGFSASGSLAALLLTSCAGAPVRSTVDAYGEAPLTFETPLCFERESAALRDRPVVDACRAAARDRGISTAEPGAKGCHLVTIGTRLESVTREYETNSGLNGGYGLYGRRRGYGLGMGLGSSTEVQEMADRQISVTIHSDATTKSPARSIDVRSAGSQSSVPAVAYEMCEAAFRDFPQNLRGKVYDIKRRDRDGEKKATDQ